MHGYECAYLLLLNEALLYIDKNKKILKVYHGKKAAEIINMEVKFEFEDIKEIKGMIASQGIARGFVKKIFGLKNMSKMTSSVD